jgi:Uma2 family endonuclease
VLVPDLAGWRRDRLPGLPRTPYFHLIPDWVCEILSPSTALFDRVKKAPLYARYGVRHLWIIDPAVCTLEVFRNDSGHRVVLSAYGGRDEVRAEPFEQVALKLGRLWVETA